MCDQCDGISERFDTNTPDDYRQLAHQLAITVVLHGREGILKKRMPARETCLGG
jgi:hypothetical protein